MKVKTTSEYQCDAPHCLSKIRVVARTEEYGYRREFNEIEKRGWATYGLEAFCKSHKELAKH